ncbi:MAG TPA: hypothetical protein VIL48_11910 [Acidimicrobiales bacterium]
MAKAATIDRFKRGETVKNLDALPGVPAGTRGRVLLVDGFYWTRYRVLFENGVDIGSIDGSMLARPKQFEEALARREAAAKAEEAQAETGGDGGGAAAGGGEAKTVNGVSVPGHLLERSKRARERLGAA